MKDTYAEKVRHAFCDLFSALESSADAGYVAELVKSNRITAAQNYLSAFQETEKIVGELESIWNRFRTLHGISSPTDDPPVLSPVPQPKSSAMPKASQPDKVNRKGKRPFSQYIQIALQAIYENGGAITAKELNERQAARDWDASEYDKRAYGLVKWQQGISNGLQTAGKNEFIVRASGKMITLTAAGIAFVEGAVA